MSNSQFLCYVEVLVVSLRRFAQVPNHGGTICIHLMQACRNPIFIFHKAICERSSGLISTILDIRLSINAISRYSLAMKILEYALFTNNAIAISLTRLAVW